MQRLASLIFMALIWTFCTCACFALPDEDGSIQPQPVKSKHPLTFRVNGQAQMTPENVTIHFVIVGDGDTLSAAQQQTQKSRQSIFSAMEGQGAKSKDVQLERFTATPLQPHGINSTADLKPLGYRVQQQFQLTMPVTNDSLDKVLRIADAAIAQGARQAKSTGYNYDGNYAESQPSMMEFTIKDSEKLTKQAMSDALARARKLAEQAAGEMGYAPGAVKLIAVHAYEVSIVPNRCDSSDGRNPLTSFSWQPIRAMVSIEANFDLK